MEGHQATPGAALGASQRHVMSGAGLEADAAVDAVGSAGGASPVGSGGEQGALPSPPKMGGEGREDQEVADEAAEVDAAIRVMPRPALARPSPPPAAPGVETTSVGRQPLGGLSLLGVSLLGVSHSWGPLSSAPLSGGSSQKCAAVSRRARI